MLTETWTTLMAHVSANQEIAIALAFGVSMGESIIGVSFFTPSTVVLVAKSGLIGAGHLAFLPIFLAASAGAVVGDLVAYAIGARLGPHLRGVWPISRNPGLIERGQDLLSRYGFWSLFASRFIGPLRWMIPTIAGACAMPFHVYVAASISSALLWAAVILAPGSFGLAWTLGGG